MPVLREGPAHHWVFPACAVPKGLKKTMHLAACRAKAKHVRPHAVPGACGAWRMRCLAHAVPGACGAWRMRCLAHAVPGTAPKRKSLSRKGLQSRLTFARGKQA